MFARLSRYHMIVPGTRRQENWRSRGQNGIARHCAVVAERKTAALNPRVRGSSPWRRTRTDLVFYRFIVILAVAGGARVGPLWDQTLYGDHLRAGFSGVVACVRPGCRAGSAFSGSFSSLVYGQ